MKWLDHLREDHPFVQIVFAFLVLVLGFLCGQLYNHASNSVLVSQNQVYTITKDILTICLTILSVMTALIGYGAFKILEVKLEDKTNKLFDVKSNWMFAEFYSAMSFIHYSDYERTQSEDHLEAAIQQGTRAHNFVMKLDQDSFENRKLIGNVKNNLGYYLAARGNDEDRFVTLRYADYLMKHLEDYPDLGGMLWPDTINYIHSRYTEEPRDHLGTTREQGNENTAEHVNEEGDNQAREEGGDG